LRAGERPQGAMLRMCARRACPRRTMGTSVNAERMSDAEGGGTPTRGFATDVRTTGGDCATVQLCAQVLWLGMAFWGKQLSPRPLPPRSAGLPRRSREPGAARASGVATRVGPLMCRPRLGPSLRSSASSHCPEGSSRTALESPHASAWFGLPRWLGSCGPASPAS